jgi:DNA polymerase III subunit delta'
MTLPPLIGHQPARRRLAQAFRRAKLPQVLLVTGPVGVGKQRLALWLAQLALCERSDLEPCGSCRGCQLVDSLSHPDLHWFVPIGRPKASDPDKQVEEAAQSIAQLMEERRSEPLYPPSDGMAIHGIATVRLLQRRASLTSVAGGQRVFIVGDADRLVPQESSQEAANALLKLLEEPPAGSLFVLTTVDPGLMLPTVRSRAVLVRLSRVSDDEVRSFLKTHLRPVPSDDEIGQRVASAAGSIGRALARGEEAGKSYHAARELLEAVLNGSGPSLEQALRQPPWSARGEFTAMLDALAETLSEAARGATGHKPRLPVPHKLLQHADPGPLLKAVEHVADAREAAWGNVNPQLLLAVLGQELAEVL